MPEADLYHVDPVETFSDILEQGMLRYGDKLALEEFTQTPLPRLTHAQLYRTVRAFSAALRALALPPRAHIAVISENRVQWGIAYLAIVAADFVAVPIDRNLKENEILTILHASDSAAAVFSESFRDMFSGFRHTIPEVGTLIDMDLAADRDGILSMPAMIERESAGDTPGGFPKTDPAQLAVLVFTSGSMGSAKGVMLSQRNICTNLVAMLRMVRINPEDRFLSVLPIHHTYECTCGFLCPMVAGASVHYARSLKTVAEDMLTAKPTVLLGVPLLYEKMYRRIIQGIEAKPVVAQVLKPLLAIIGALDALGVHGLRARVFHEIHEKFGGAIRLLIVGGAAPDPAVARGFRSFGFTFIQGYGLTETSPILALNRVGNFRDEAAGLPLPGIELRIDTPNALGQGEILARGPSIMLGYYKNEEATQAALRDGFFCTGDVGFIDGDGFLHICGRKKNVIIARNGENVYPEELEDHVNRIPYVLESVVHGVRSERGDEEIAVIVVPNAEQFIEYARRTGGQVTEQLIREVIDDEIRKLNRHLPVHKQIRRVVVKDTEFEKTTTQKIKRYVALH